MSETRNATDRPYPTHRTMHQLFEVQAGKQPDAVAVVHGEHVVTYAALAVRADKWARRLRAVGVAPELRVGIHLTRSPELIAAMLGVLKAGGAYVPLDPDYPRERLELMIHDATMAALVTDAPEENLAVDAGLPLLRPGQGDEAPPVGQAGAPAPPNLAYVLYTSGSTGRPKGVAITHANAVDLLYWTAETFADELERVLATTSICFDCSILEIFGPLSWGGTVVLRVAAMDIGTDVEGSRVRLLHTVPSVVDELLRANRLPASATTAILGGEAIRQGLAEKVYARSNIQRLVNLYGPAECTSYATMAVVDRTTQGAPPIGQPVANTRVYLLTDGEPVGRGADGEIFVAGAGLTRGYLGQAAMTAERYVPEPFSGRPGERMYRTGDVGRLEADGQLAFLGRVDDQVKVRGVRIEPGEVEHVLRGHPAVAEAVVTVEPNDVGQHRLVAYVVAEAQREVRPHALRLYLRERLPSPLVPDLVEVLDRLPRQPNGKLDRRALTKHAPTSCASAAAERRSLTALESMITRLWAEAVDADVGVDDDIFEIGGHSLAALRVRARLAELTGQTLPARLFFEHPTVAELAAELAPRLGEPTAYRPPQPASERFGGGSTRLSPTQRAILKRSDNRSDEPGLTLPLVVRLTGTPPAGCSRARGHHVGEPAPAASVGRGDRPRRRACVGAATGSALCPGGPAAGGPGRAGCRRARRGSPRRRR